MRPLLRRILPLFVVVALDAASSAAVLPVLPFRLLELGATPLVLGLVLAAEALSQLVAAPWLGQLSDRFGRKPVLLVSQAGALLSLGLLAAADGVALVLAARVLLGLTAASFVAAAAYAADNSAAADRRQAIGILSAGLGLGGILGPGLTAWLAGASLTAPVWAAFALSATSMLVTGLWVRDRHGAGRLAGDTAEDTAVRARASLRSVLAAPIVRILLLVLLCHYLAYGLLSSQLAVFLSDTFTWNGHVFGARELGYLLAADGALNILAQLLLLPWLGRRFGERGLIVLVLSVLAVGYLLAGGASSITMLALAVLCVSTGAALARPTFLTALSVHVPRQRQGVVMGAFQSLVAVTDIMSPMLAGLIVGQRLYGVWIGAVVAITLAGAGLARGRLPLAEAAEGVAEIAASGRMRQ